MKIVISGAGDTGFYLAGILHKQGHDLVLFEKNEKRYQFVRDRLDAQILLGDGANALTLEPILDDETDFFLAVTNSDESNIISCLIARKFGAKRAIARISDPSNLIHPLLIDDPKISVLNAEMAVAKDLVGLVGNPTADEIEFFAKGKAEMVRFHVAEDAKIVSRKLKEVSVPSSWLIIAVIHNNQFSIVSGESILEPGDQVIVVGNPDKTKEIEGLLGLRAEKVRRVIIVGYNAISAYVAMNLQKRGIQVRLVEEKQKSAEEAANRLHDVLVLHGDGTAEDVLDQAGIDQTDYLLALTEDAENNILIALLAKEHHVRKVVALAQKRHYHQISEKIGVDSIVNPRSAMVDEIIRSIHHKDVAGISILEGGQGQAVELFVNETSKAVGKPISKIKLPKQTLIGAIVREDKLIIPRGADEIAAGDQLVVFTTGQALSEVKKIFNT